MSMSDHYRKRHLELMNKQKQEESLLTSCLMLGLLVLGIMAWVTALAMLMPE